MTKACINCRYYSMWEGVCMYPNNKPLFPTVYADGICGRYEPDLDELELENKEEDNGSYRAG